MDEQIATDPRVKRLARRMKVTHPDAIGRLFLVWLVCYQRRAAVVRDIDIDTAADLEGWARAMAEEELAIEQPDGRFYVCGVSDRIEFLNKQTERGRAGGRAKAENQADLFESSVRQAHARYVAKPEPKRSVSVRQGSGLAYSPSPDLAPAPDPAPDHVPAPVGGSTTPVDNSEKPRQPVTPAPNATGSPPRDPSAGPSPSGTPTPKNASTGTPGASSDDALTMAHLLLGFICTNNPNSRTAKAVDKHDATAERWARTIDLIHTRDGMTWGEIHGMIVWSQRDSFWKTNILGADSLRDKWDKMDAQRGRKPPAKQAGPTALAMAEYQELKRREEESA